MDKQLDIKNHNKALAGFVPHRLDITGEPQLKNFPLNILFVSFKKVEGKTISGTALYLPAIATYEEKKGVQHLLYYNQYFKEQIVIIDYDTKSKKYSGYKYFDDKLVLSADGAEWNMFFIHLTMQGLINGEKCMFETEN